jgi:tRNA(Ile)-lysidine synthase TilS/MesJ
MKTANLPKNIRRKPDLMTTISQIKRCSRCVMPETVPGITFDEEGVCNLCRKYVCHECRDEADLKQLIEESRTHGNRFDCIVPLSGGRDSTFVLYAAVKRYGLKVLAVNYDTEFRVDQALVNIQNACRHLGVELLIIRSRWNIASKMVCASVRAALPYGLAAIRGDLCDACVYGFKSVVYRAAERYKTPLILWGSSSNEQTDPMLGVLAVGRRGLARREKLLNLQYYKSQIYGLLQRLEFPVPGNRVLSRKPVSLRNRTIREVRLFDYLPWDREEIKQTIARELSWRKPAGHVSTWRTDCKLHVLVNYCYLRQFGCSKDCFGYCNMINAGQMSRHEALAQEEQAAGKSEQDALRLLRSDIGLSESELASIASYTMPKIR